MHAKGKKRPYKKIALALSLCAILLWAVMGTGASLAWFADTSPEIRNIFHIADFDLEVSHELTDGVYEPVDEQTVIFDESALYEPGYVQVVYLKIENKGTVPFDFKTTVWVDRSTEATNVYEETFDLKKYLKFGLVTDTDEDKLKEKVATRALAKEIATLPLDTYETAVDELAANQTVYVALIVRMPEEVTDDANYRGETVPEVELGIIVEATQQR